MKRLLQGFFFLLLPLALLGGFLWWRAQEKGTAAVAYRTAQVSRGDLVVSINATGTVEPEEVIDVGAQVAGQILAFGKDAQGKTVDYGSMVEAGTILARIDDALYRADLLQTKAQVESGKAGLQRAEADLEQSRSKLAQAEKEWQRAQSLANSEALASISYDTYEANFRGTKANVAVSEAAILQAKAVLDQAAAGLIRVERNLEYCTIKSPVKGVIIDRRVNMGQTVVASLNAPSLFLIAKDLKRIQVWVAVNEADIGDIVPELPVTFTVDAFPGESFRGKVGKIRLNASMTQNVVTYTVEIITDNASGRLLPYLTANVKFELDRMHNVFQVPNAALRWLPAPEQIVAEAREERHKGREKKGAGPAANKLWPVEGRFVRPLAVKVGKSDGTNTEVSGEKLSEGMTVAYGIIAPSKESGGASNPFTPKFPSRR